MNIAQKAQKIKRFSQLNLPFKFDNQTVSSNVTFSYLEAFKSIINFRGLIANKIGYQKPNNAKFTTVDIIDYLVDATILGYSKFQHMDDLRQDQVFRQIKDSDLPSEKACRDLLKALPEESLKETRELNKDLLATQAKNENPREVMLDFDDTVCTVFGNQEGAKCGYNPRYHGRPSFKEKVGMLGQTHELLNLTLESGNHHSNHNFLEFFKECINMLPASWYLKRIRADRGFFDQSTLEYCEENDYEYVVKAKMQKGVQKIIDYVNDNPRQHPWTSISKAFSVAEITVPLPAWSKARRFIFVRKSLPKVNDKQMILFNEFTYEYQAIVTNIDYMTPEEIFHDYNQRCNVENKIDELK